MSAADTEIVCRRYPNAVYALGLALSFLAARSPFASYRAGQIVSSVTGQIRRGHYIFAMRGNRVVGYTGWGLCSSDIAERHLRGEYNPTFYDCREGDVVLLMIIASVDSTALRVMMRFMRALYPEHSYAGKRAIGNELRPHSGKPYVSIRDV